MISIASIQEYLAGELEERGLFLVEAVVRPGNKITVYIDNMKGVTLDECISVSRYLENKLDRNAEDFELEVSSPGLDKPLKLPVQFEKNAGRFIDIVRTDGIKITAKLLGIRNGIIQVEKEAIMKDPVTRKKTIERHVQEIRQDEIKSAKVVISVKK
jgi:ribosome maturation factor RimP